MAYNYTREGETHPAYQKPLRAYHDDQPPPYSSVGQTDPIQPPPYAPNDPYSVPSYAPQPHVAPKTQSSDYNPYNQYTSQTQHAPETRYTQQTQYEPAVVEIEMSESYEREYEHQPYRYLHDKDKMGFLRKVYLLLLSQLTLTTFVSSICMYVDFVRNYCLQNLWLFWVGIVLSFVLLFAMFCLHAKFPINFYLLFAWTFVESYTIGVICALYVSVGYQDVVLQAFILTVVITVSLTVFTVQSKINFSFLKGFLFAMLWVLIAWGIINIIFGMMFQMIYSLIGAIVFSLFIVYDTYRIWKSDEFDYDYGYIDASISLYLDIINLFLFLLSLLSSGDN